MNVFDANEMNKELSRITRDYNTRQEFHNSQQNRQQNRQNVQPNVQQKLQKKVRFVNNVGITNQQFKNPILKNIKEKNPTYRTEINNKMANMRFSTSDKIINNNFLDEYNPLTFEQTNVGNRGVINKRESKTSINSRMSNIPFSKQQQTNNPIYNGKPQLSHRPYFSIQEKYDNNSKSNQNMKQNVNQNKYQYPQMEPRSQIPQSIYQPKGKYQQQPQQQQQQQ